LVCLTEAARLNGLRFAKCHADYHSGRWTAKRAFAFPENDAAVTGRDAAEFCSTFSPTVPVSMKKPDLLVRLTACDHILRQEVLFGFVIWRARDSLTPHEQVSVGRRCGASVALAVKEPNALSSDCNRA
jgi:hypothetical protein